MLSACRVLRAPCDPPAAYPMLRPRARRGSETRFLASKPGFCYRYRSETRFPKQKPGFEKSLLRGVDLRRLHPLLAVLVADHADDGDALQLAAAADPLVVGLVVPLVDEPVVDGLVLLLDLEHVGALLRFAQLARPAHQGAGQLDFLG